MGNIAGAGGFKLPFIGKAGLKGTPEPIKAKPIPVVRVGFVGVGGRSAPLVRALTNIDGVEIRAICDIIPDRVERAQFWVTDMDQPKPDGYSGGPEDYKNLCDRDDIDLVVNAAPWEIHTDICVAAMNAGKHTATEVPAAVTIEECWRLVEASERNKKHCVILENCCYFRDAMMILRMVRKGLFGDLLHAEVGYQHYRVYCMYSGDKLSWAGKHAVERNGNLYPTHPIGPVGQWMNINRGDRFDYLVSMSGKSRGMNVFAAEKFGRDHELAKMNYALGDINTTMIRTVNGKTIMLYHDVQAPRPYDLIFRCQGTKGISMGTRNEIFIHGRTDKAGGHKHAYESMDNYKAEYEHPLWEAMENKAKQFGGHGGADYLEMYRLVRALQTGTYPDNDAYDCADWSVISELSERSVAKKSRPVDFPDFTRGAWKTRKPLGIIGA